MPEVIDDAELRKAVRAGQTQVVRDLLDAGADIRVIDEGKNTVLHLAVKSGEVELVAELLKRKASVNGRNRQGYRPLHWAAALGHGEIVRLLVEHGATVNVKTNTSFIIRETQTPLFQAIENGHEEIARYLVEKGAELDALNDTSHRTALSSAIGGNHVELARFLLERGASPNGVSSPGQNPNYPDYYIFPLGEARSAEAVRLLVDAGADVNAEAQNVLHSWNALQAVVEHYSDLSEHPAREPAALATIGALIDAGAQAGTGRNLIALAGSPAVAALLCRAFDGDSADDSDGGLARAIWDRAASVYDADDLVNLHFLLQKARPGDGALVGSALYDNRETSLHNLLYKCRWSGDDDEKLPLELVIDSVRLLLGAGAEVDAVETLYDETPLHKAARAASTSYEDAADLAVWGEIFTLLLDAGATVNAVNEDGATAFDLVRHPEHHELLRARGGEPGRFPQRLFDLIDYGETDHVARLLALTPDPDRRNPDDLNLLQHWAIQRDADPACLPLLLGYLPIGFGSGGTDALMLACDRGQVRNADLLLDHGADPKASDADGDTALALLLQAGRPAATEDLAAYLALVSRLLAAGADLAASDSKGVTALQRCRTKTLATQVARLAKALAKT